MRTLPMAPTAGAPSAAAGTVPSVLAAWASPRARRATRDGFRVAIGLLIIMVVSRIHQNYRFIAVFRPAMLLAVGACAYAWARPIALTRENVLRHWWVRPIVVLVVLACVGAPFGISVGNSGKFVLEAYSRVLMLVALVVLGIRHAGDLAAFVRYYLAGAGILTLMATFLFKLDRGPGLARLSDLYMFDANDVGLIFVTTIPLALAFAAVWRGRARLAMLVLLAFLGVGIARTGSRGAFLGLLVTGAFLLVTTRGVGIAKKLALVGAVAMALVVAAPPGYFDQMNTLTNPKDDYNWTSPTGRKAVTKRGIGYMMAYPVFGVGINNFAKAECTISPRVQAEALGVGIRCTPPHNTWIQVGAELGFLGFVTWLVFLFVPMARLFALSRKLPLSWRRGDFEQQTLFACAAALPASLLGFAVSSTFLTFAWIDIPYLLVVFAGTTWFFARRRLRHDAAVARAAVASAGASPAAAPR